ELGERLLDNVDRPDNAGTEATRLREYHSHWHCLERVDRRTSIHRFYQHGIEHNAPTSLEGIEDVGGSIATPSYRLDSIRTEGLPGPARGRIGSHDGSSRSHRSCACDRRGGPAGDGLHRTAGRARDQP